MRLVTGGRWCGSLLVLAMVGCGSGDTPAPSPPREGAETASGGLGTGTSLPAQLAAASPQPDVSGAAATNPALAESVGDLSGLLQPVADNPLVGSWLGLATLDTGLLQQKLARVPDDERGRLQKIAEIFLTYQVAMDLYSDGRLGMVVQFALDGKEQLVSATGTWKVVARDEESMVVELVEQIDGQTPNTSQVRIMIHPDGQQIARPAELDEQLAVCEPMFVFNRMPEDLLQQSTASGSVGGVVR